MHTIRQTDRQTDRQTQTSEQCLSLNHSINWWRLHRLHHELTNRTKSQQFDGQAQLVQRRPKYFRRSVLLQSENNVSHNNNDYLPRRYSTIFPFTALMLLAGNPSRRHQVCVCVCVSQNTIPALVTSFLKGLRD